MWVIFAFPETALGWKIAWNQMSRKPKSTIIFPKQIYLRFFWFPWHSVPCYFSSEGSFWEGKNYSPLQHLHLLSQSWFFNICWSVFICTFSRNCKTSSTSIKKGSTTIILKIGIRLWENDSNLHLYSTFTSCPKVDFFQLLLLCLYMYIQQKW